MAKNIRRYGITRNNDGIMKMIVCRVGGEMADGCKVWYEIDPKTGEYLDDRKEYLLFTRGGWSEFEEL